MPLEVRMQGWFTAWLELPIWVIFASLFAFYLTTAGLPVWLSFWSPLRGSIQSLRGVVAPYFSSVGIIFGLLVAFLSNDIWDRNKLAERVVQPEADTLVALYSHRQRDRHRSTARVDSRICERRGRRRVAPSSNA